MQDVVRSVKGWVTLIRSDLNEDGFGYIFHFMQFDKYLRNLYYQKDLIL